MGQGVKEWVWWELRCRRGRGWWGGGEWVGLGMRRGELLTWFFGFGGEVGGG